MSATEVQSERRFDMHHIDRIRLSNHPDPRMRAAAADAARLRSDLWGFALTRALRGVFTATTVPLRAAARRLGLSPGCSRGSTATGDPWIAPRMEGCG